MFCHKQYLIIMNRFVFLYCIVQFCFIKSAYNQIYLDHMVIGSIGASSTTQNIQLSYTLGEPVTQTLSSESFFFTQGFHQPSIVSNEIQSDTCPLLVYNGISPNNDHRNDFWYIGNIEILPENEVFIYDRAGTLMWYKKDYNNTNNSWLGEKNSGEKLPPGTYFYIISSVYLQKNECVGWVEIIP